MLGIPQKCSIYTKRKAAIKKIGPPAVMTSSEVIIAEYDAILSQWERGNFYNCLSNYTNGVLSLRFLFYIS